jgi:sialidase-1
MKQFFLILSLLVIPPSVIAAEKFEAPIRAYPVLNDGSELTILEFTLSTDGEKTLTEIKLDTGGTTDLKDIAEIGVEHLRKAGNRWFAKTQPMEQTITLKGKMEFPKGNHKCRVVIRTKKGADLLHRVGVQISGFQFADGSQLNVAADKNYQAQRLAYPIHKQGQFDCHTFRIPAISKANNGDLLALYDLRYNSRKDLQEHIDIGLSVSNDGGQTWADPRPIMDMGEFGGKSQKENGCSDPGILIDAKTGEIFVSAVWTHGKPNTHQWVGKGSEPGYDIHNSSQFMVVRSKDNGLTWSQPENWTKQLKDESWHLFAPAPGNGITMKDGTLVMPSQGRDAKGFPFSNITWSKDHGKTWNVSTPATDDTSECSVAELSDGSLMLNIRDNRNRKDKSETNGRAVGVSKDLGKTWKKHGSDHGALPEPTCMASLISHNNGKHQLFFSNPHNKNSRSDITIQMSLDDGKSWPEKSRILLDSGRGNGYSSLVIIDDKTIGILYESSVADMVFQKIPLSEFVK